MPMTSSTEMLHRQDGDRDQYDRSSEQCREAAVDLDAWADHLLDCADALEAGTIPGGRIAGPRLALRLRRSAETLQRMAHRDRAFADELGSREVAA